MFKTCLWIMVLIPAVLFSAPMGLNDGQRPPRLAANSAAPDSLAIEAFFTSHPDLIPYKNEVKALYKKRGYSFLWYDNEGLTDFAKVLFNEISRIREDGLPVLLPYSEEFDKIYLAATKRRKESAELLLTSLYIFYTEKVFSGLDPEKSRLTGWYLPREKTSYSTYLEMLLEERDIPKLFSQYYKLKKALKKYRNIEGEGGWDVISVTKNFKTLKPNDTSATIANVRSRLFREGYLNKDSGKLVFDEDLLTGIHHYKEKHNKLTDSLITRDFIKELNVSVGERIECIMVNMERCRWIPTTMNDSREFIAVNIPSYRLHYFREGKSFLTSKVVVGKEATKTVVFSGEMSHVIFSPYWNVPKSILLNEILPDIKKDRAYLAKHNMEWVGNRVRQRPGGSNALGLVKFIFPNSSNIYLHDTPSKSLFNKDKRAFSHGCIRVEKARELALAIMKKDADWDAEKVDKAMLSGKESTYTLKQKIPVYIAYFTAWADEKGNTAFYEDIYKRDARLSQLLFNSSIN